jgi:hypothetical protein
LAPSSSGTNPPDTPDQGNLKVSSSPNRLEPRYRRVKEAAMNNRKTEDVVFETIASCTLVIAALAITALLYQLITVAVPRLGSLVLPQVLMTTGF